MKKQLPYFLLVFLLPILGVVWWWGAFSEVQVENGQMRGPYHYAYLTQTSELAKMGEAQQTALHKLKEQKIATGAPITVLLTDPRVTKRKEQVAQVGYLIEPGTPVAEPLQVADIPARRVVVARVHAHPSFAPGKAYAALIKYLDQQGLKLVLPTVETYHDDELSVEMAL
ncbi:MAG: GyrI-like domain-containing protein [Sulfuricella sp.]|nr:GyrI-like domain-containing protein [Sulfuricella sp.]